MRLTKRYKKIELFVFLIVMLIALEYFSHLEFTAPLIDLTILGISELIKGIFMGTIFTLFVEEHVDNQKEQSKI